MIHYRSIRYTKYIRINSIKSPDSAAGNISEPRLMLEKWPKSMCVYRRVSAVRAVGVPVFVCLRSSCNHVTEVGGP